MKLILRYLWEGLWQGIGVEVSFFLLWVGWRMLHSKVAPRLDSEHIIHKIQKYFE